MPASRPHAKILPSTLNGFESPFRLTFAPPNEVENCSAIERRGVILLDTKKFSGDRIHAQHKRRERLPLGRTNKQFCSYWSRRCRDLYRVEARVRVARPRSEASPAAKRQANHSSIWRAEQSGRSTVLTKGAGRAVPPSGTRRDGLCGEADSTHKSSTSFGPYAENIRLSRENNFALDRRVRARIECGNKVIMAASASERRYALLRVALRKRC